MIKQNIEVYGDFKEICVSSRRERLCLSFNTDTLNIDELWDTTSLSASFLSTFWGEFMLCKPDPASKRSQKRVVDAIHFVGAELLGNSVKFSCHCDYMAEIFICLDEDALYFYVLNSIDPATMDDFKAFIERLLTEDTKKLFLQQLEENALDQNGNISKIGYLTLINDYGVKLAWKFENIASDMAQVTTQAKLPIEWQKGNGENNGN